MPRQGTRGVAPLVRGTDQALSAFLPPDRTGDLIQCFRGAGEAADVKSEGQHRTCAPLRRDVSARLYEFLQRFRIPTGTSARGAEAERVPLLVRIWNSGRGSLAERFGLEEGAALPVRVLEHFAYRRPGGSPLQPVNEFHAHAFLGVSPDLLRVVNRLASKVNAVLRSLLERRGLDLVSLDPEFGREGGNVVVRSEISLHALRCVEGSPFRGPARDPFGGSCAAAHEAFPRRVFGGDAG